MSTTQSAIRPRSRARARGIEQPKDSQPEAHVRSERTPGADTESKPTAPAPLVLARLPEIAELPVAKPISLNLSWVLNFRWQHRVRRLMQMEPNYLVGGVLALVVFLLVMITMRNREEGPAAGGVSGGAMAATAAPIQAATIAQATVIAPSQKLDTVIAIAPQPVREMQVQADAMDSAAGSGMTAAQDPLAGIYYPRTLFGAPAGLAFEQVAGQSVAAFAAGNLSAPADGMRTAMRDRIDSGAPQAVHTEPGVARLDGFITRPR